MSCLVFDTSTIISIATNNLLQILGPLKQAYGGEFCIPSVVKSEVIDRPLNSKKFKLEALQIISEVIDGNLILIDEPPEEVERIAGLTNSIFMAYDNYIQVVHRGEAAVIVHAKQNNADALVIDERTTRLLIESPMSVARILSSKMHTNIAINRKNLKEFQEYTKGMTVLRSTELGVMAYDLGLLNAYMRPETRHIAAVMPKKDLLDGLLWGLKLRGCSISTEEISEIMRLKGL